MLALKNCWACPLSEKTLYRPLSWTELLLIWESCCLRSSAFKKKLCCVRFTIHLLFYFDYKGGRDVQNWVVIRKMMHAWNVFSGSAQNMGKAEIIHRDITGLLWQRFVLLFCLALFSCFVPISVFTLVLVGQLTLLFWATFMIKTGPWLQKFTFEWHLVWPM